VKTILIVEDEPILRDVLGEVLNDYGYQVLTASSGWQALDIMEQHDLDAILLDVMLPGMDGRDLYKEVRNLPHKGSVPVIMMSAIIRPGQLDAGIADFVTKPFNMEDLVSAIERAIGPGHPLP
jgi:CheY-like chemotaxis protein